jgi:hypothetical protein
MDKREGWLLGLKEDDKVYIYIGPFGQMYKRGAVTKITPTGRIRCGDLQFGPDGEVYGNYEGWIKPRLVEPTVTVVAAWRAERMRTIIALWARAELSSADPAVLEAVWSAIPRKSAGGGL